MFLSITIRFVFISLLYFQFLNANASVLQYYDVAVEAGEMFDINPCFILGVIEQEGGSVGKDTHHRNGSVDTGIAQINRNGEWMRYFSKEYGISYDLIRDNPLVSVMLVSYILRKEFDRTGDVIYMLSSYHVGHGKRATVRGLKYSQAVLERVKRYPINGVNCDA